MDSQRTQFIQQWKALYFKNLTVKWRNRSSTLMQILSPLIFMFLLFLIVREMENSSGKAAEVLISLPIPPCEDSFAMRQPCFDFVWSSNSSGTIASIVTRIMKNNPGRPIPPTKVISFKGKEEVDEWMFNNPLRCAGALLFEEITDTIISYGIQINSTQIPKRWKTENSMKFLLPLQLAAEREIARTIIGDVNISWVLALEQFARPKVVHSAKEIEMTFQGSAEIFFLAMAMFTFVFQIRSLVIEKEQKFRQAMTMVGLYDSAYWLSWLASETTFLLISSVFIVVYGMTYQFPFFLRNNFTVLLLTFFLFQLTMTGFAFMVSTLVGSSSANKIGLFIFFLAFGAQLVKPFLLHLPATYNHMWLLFPPNIFFKATEEIFSATARGGMSWSEISECPGNCEMAMVRIFQWYIGTFFLWFTIAIYLDNILPNSSGVRKSIFYFLYPGYWTGNSGKMIKEGGIFSCMHSVPQVEHTIPYDEDVFEEENTVRQQLGEGFVDLNVAVQLRGLAQTYPGKREIGCCEGNRKSHFHAIKGLWVSAPKDQLFCLLGPNGAGKTTMISCLTGITPVTSGDALIYGQSVRSSVGMSNIRKIIGVCPQFDILWDALSGEEHLRLFASIKGIPVASIESIVHKSLYQVRLLDAATTRVGGYSEGMKRRLSVAIALIGDPKLVILDEPTTGMDSINRRHVWDIIQNAKKGRAIILTTHSMEEADILSDRIGIMANGTLRCIGTSIHLKSKFGSGFVINVSFMETTGANARSSHEALKGFFKHHLNLLPKEETQHFLSYVVPRKKESKLKNIFRELQLREREFGIDEIQLGLTTLEEAFLNVAKKEAFENAAIDDRMETLTLESGITLLIPMGAEHIGIPGSASAQNVKGLMVEVYWGQDADGNLCISGHSTETPIPDDVDCTLPSTLPKGAPCRGIVLEMPLTRRLFP